MIGVYDYTVILTYLSAVAAVVGMGLSVNGHTDIAVLLLAFCGILDMFDGTVARTKKNRSEFEKKFGIQIDSFCDLVSFGVYPSVICFCLKEGFTPEKAVLILLPLAGLIRLAYFNVMEEERQERSAEKRKYYTGLPITSSAVVFPFLYLFRDLLSNDSYYVLWIILTTILSVLFVLKIRIRKPGKKMIIAITVLAVGFLIRFLLHFGA